MHSIIRVVLRVYYPTKPAAHPEDGFPADTIDNDRDASGQCSTGMDTLYTPSKVHCTCLVCYFSHTGCAPPGENPQPTLKTESPAHPEDNTSTCDALWWYTNITGT